MVVRMRPEKPMTSENVVKLLQMTGAALAIPAAAAGTFAAYQNYFSSDVTCQKLRSNIVAVMERNVAPETKRSLLKKDDGVRQALRRGRSRRARQFPSGRNRTSRRRRPCPGSGIRACGAVLPAPADRRARAVWCSGLQGALWLGRAQSPAGRFVGAALQRLQHLRYVIAAARHHLVGENDAAGLVGTAGRNERSDQAAEQAADGCLRARPRNPRRERAVVGRGRPGIMLVSSSSTGVLGASVPRAAQALSVKAA